MTITSSARQLRHELRPLVWTVLEEVALDAEDDDGRLVASTSARRIADQLGLDPGSAARALLVLRRRGLLQFERQSGPAGRFGLSLYVMGGISGLTVIAAAEGQPCRQPRDTADAHTPVPCMKDPDTARPCVEDRDTAQPCFYSPGTTALQPEGSPSASNPMKPEASPTATVSATPIVPKQRSRRGSPSGQEALDLGLGES